MPDTNGFTDEVDDVELTSSQSSSVPVEVKIAIENFVIPQEFAALGHIVCHKKKEHRSLFYEYGVAITAGKKGGKLWLVVRKLNVEAT